MAGRRPKPTAIKILEGNAGHRPLVPDDVQPEQIAPEMPKHLSPVARREWRYMVRVLMELGILTNVDGKALAAYCEAYAQSEIALMHITKIGQLIGIPAVNRETGIVQLAADGTVIYLRWEINPSMKIFSEMQKLMKAFLIEFGLTPASRSRLKIAPKKAKDPFETKMQRRVGFELPTQPSPEVPTAPGYVNKEPIN